jgi:hypothetical protein
MNAENTTLKKRLSKRLVSQFFSYDWITKNITFLLFISALAILYIANGHMADNRIRKINETGRRLKELQYEYKTVKSEIMFRSRESELVKAAVPLGLKMDSVPPLRIKAVDKTTE